MHMHKQDSFFRTCPRSFRKAWIVDSSWRHTWGPYQGSKQASCLNSLDTSLFSFVLVSGALVCIYSLDALECVRHANASLHLQKNLCKHNCKQTDWTGNLIVNISIARVYNTVFSNTFCSILHFIINLREIYSKCYVFKILIYQKN